MRRLALLVLVVGLLTAGCGQRAQTYTIDKGGKRYTVDTGSQTIREGNYIYRYELTRTTDGYSLEITYPNGATYSYSQGKISGVGSWSEDYDAGRYAPGTVLREVLEESVLKEKGRSANLGLAVLLAGLGVWCAAAPRSVWYLKGGWKYKDAEPSKPALWVYRAVGAGLVVIAAVAAL